MKLSMEKPITHFEFNILNPTQKALPDPSTTDLIAGLMVIINQMDGVETSFSRFFDRNNVIVTVIATHNLDGIKEALDALSEVYQ